MTGHTWTDECRHGEIAESCDECKKDRTAQLEERVARLEDVLVPIIAAHYTRGLTPAEVEQGKKLLDEIVEGRE